MGNNHIDIKHGQLKQCRNQFTKELRKAHSLVLFHCKDKNVAQIKLIEKVNPYTNREYTIDHYFEADGFIKGDDCRHCKNIDRDIIKKLLTPKADFCFQVWKDAKTNDCLKSANLHSDMILLHIGEQELYFDVQTTPDNTARLTRY